MPKVGASLSDVSTTFVPVDPDMYHCTFKQPEMTTKNERTTIVVELTVVSGEETGADNAGRVIRDRISMHKKDGTPNEFGATQLKRYIEAGIPDSEDWSDERWDDFDTDELTGCEAMLAVTIEEYDEALPGGRKQVNKTNRVKRVLSV